MSHVRFTKMHGLGNDYLIVNGRAQTVDDPPALARAMSDRHRGVGADGLILILPPEEGVDACARMRMFNADGSEAEMCGNGIRCVCKYIVDQGICEAHPVRIQTGAGVLALEYGLDGAGKVDRVTVNMGPPNLDPAAIGVDGAHIERVADHRYTIEVDGGMVVCTLVSMGNPHVVIYRDSVEDVELERIGPLIERHPAFPDRVNVHFVEVVSRGEVIVRTWERGSGATLACGTGAAAVCAAGAVNNLTDRSITAYLPGGDLQLHWDEATDHVLMTGPAVEVFSGVWPDQARNA